MRALLVSPLLLAASTLAVAEDAAPSAVRVERGMVAAARAEAAKAGVDVLEAGGNAIDAAVATSLALGVVEPFASGLGGGGFLVYREAATGTVYALDFRETAPQGLTNERLTVDGELSTKALQEGPLSVGVPGAARGLMAAHERFGTMDRAVLAKEAARLAREGVPITQLLAATILEKEPLLAKDKAAAAIFLGPDGHRAPTGTPLVQEALARTLERFGAEGDAAVNGPDAAATIAKAVQAAGGVMTAEDIVAYEARWREPLAASWRGFDLYTMGPPSAGGAQVLHALSLLETDTSTAFSYPTFASAFAIAQRRADHAIADPEFMAPDALALPPREEIAADRAVLEEKSAAGAAEVAPAPPVPPGNTTHFCVVDRAGNMVSLTQTINSYFGSGLAVGELGIVLNNELADFDLREGSPNHPAPGKIPRSSMSPTIVVRDGVPVATLGSPAGRRIPSAVVQVMLRHAVFGEPLAQAVDASRIHIEATSREIAFESRLSNDDAASVAKRLGGDWKLLPKGPVDRFFGGVHAIWLEKNADGTLRPVGAADPRREGAALAEK